MGEALTRPDAQPSMASPEQQAVPDGSLSYRERLYRGLGRMADGAMSFVDLAAGIALARDDLRLTRNVMQRLDEPYDGIIERQAQADRLSLGLESDIILDFRRDAQQAGFTDVDGMSDEQRSAVAEQSVGARIDDIAAEIAAFHPEWSAEEVSEAATSRVADVSTLFGLSAEQRDHYLAAQLKYHELQAAIPEIQSELSELRAERSQRLSRIGRVALRGVVDFAGRVRELPNALSARAVVAGMAFSDRVRLISPERWRFVGAAAGIALAGITSYLAVRHGIGSGGSNSYALISSNTPLTPSSPGIPTPTHIGGLATPNHIGGTSIPTPTHVGGSGKTPNRIGGMLGPATPDHIAGTTPVATPNRIGGRPTPDRLGATATPDRVGGSPDITLSHVGGANGENLVSVKTSDELFASSGSVDKWPGVITVSHWNPRDLDGSLTGIGRQMLVRSGVQSPSDEQIARLVDALRPQARPNGYLLYGQKLDLRPATKVMQDILQR